MTLLPHINCMILNHTVNVLALRWKKSRPNVSVYIVPLAVQQSKLAMAWNAGMESYWNNVNRA